MAATLAPEKILHDLAELWISQGKQSHPESAGVLRACSMTLLVLTEAADDTQDLGETIAALMPEHPSRTILVRLSGPGERSLSERVYSQCWMPFGQRRQICCEQVEITVSDAALGDLVPVLLPLTVPDLPVIVWCRSSRLMAMDAFTAIGAMARKVIVDTSGAPDPAAALLRLSRLVTAGFPLGDLAWTLITRWREMLSQIFENQQNLAHLQCISAIYVEWGGSRQAPAYYLAAWIRDMLAPVGVRPTLSIARARQGDYLRLRLVGDGFTLELSRQQDRMVTILNGASQYTNLPQPADYHLMREELGIVRHDPVFEKTLTSAVQLAHPIQQ